jgi:hypothetical protein
MLRVLLEDEGVVDTMRLAATGTDLNVVGKTGLFRSVQDGTMARK